MSSNVTTKVGVMSSLHEIVTDAEALEVIRICRACGFDPGQTIIDQAIQDHGAVKAAELFLIAAATQIKERHETRQ